MHSSTTHLSNMRGRGAVHVLVRSCPSLCPAVSGVAAVAAAAAAAASSALPLLLVLMMLLLLLLLTTADCSRT